MISRTPATALTLLTTSFALLYIPASTRIYPFEVLAVALLPVTLAAVWPAYPQVRVVVVLGVAWAVVAACVQSLLYSAGDMASAVLTPVFMVADLCLLTWLLRQPRSRVMLVGALCVALLLQGAIQPDIGVQGNLWKFWLAIPVSIVAISFANRLANRGHSALAGAVLVACCAANFLFDYRSLAGMILVSVGMTQITRSSIPARVKGLTAGLVVKLVLGAALATVIAFLAYGQVQDHSTTKTESR